MTKNHPDPRDNTAQLIQKLDLLYHELEKLKRDRQAERLEREQAQKWLDRSWEISKTLSTLAFTLIVSATITVIIKAIFT